MGYSSRKQDLGYRQYVIVAIVVLVALTYVLRLFYLQVVDSTYKDSADSNAFLKQTIYPSRGLIYDRDGRLVVSNKPVYDVMVILREMVNFDTLQFCSLLDISREEFDERIALIKDKKKNPGYSRYTPQVFMSQLSPQDYARIQETLFRFPGVSTQQRVMREYQYENAALALGSIGEVTRNQLEADNYYRRGDYRGQSGIEMKYEERQVRRFKTEALNLADQILSENVRECPTGSVI